MKIRPDEVETAEETPGAMHPFAEQFRAPWRGDKPPRLTLSLPLKEQPFMTRLPLFEGPEGLSGPNWEQPRFVERVTALRRKHRKVRTAIASARTLLCWK